MAADGRRAAAFVLSRWLLEHGHPADMLPDGPDRAFVQDLVYTTIRRFRPLRSLLGRFVARWPKGELEAYLLLGAAQIMYMPEIPDFAAVSATVDAAKACPNKAVAKMVNAVLRNVIRRRGEFDEYLRTAPLAERESYPNALVSRWVARYGETDAARLAVWHNTPAETWLLRRPAGWADGTHAVRPQYERLPRGQKISSLPGYAEGEFIVQDPSTAGAVELLDVREGLSVLDFCAAPGGKTAHIAWLLGGTGRLVAQEVNPRRLERLHENLARLGLGNAAAGAKRVEAVSAVADGELFDRVLVDAPCSNTGVLRRRPDARWRWSAERIKELTSLQAEILARAAAHVAPGGILVYSTCSNEPEENSGQVAAFCAAHPEFTAGRTFESVPFASGHDGAFACALHRQ